MVAVKRTFWLGVDRREAATLEGNLRGCPSMAMESMVGRSTPASTGNTGRSADIGDDALARYDDNWNGRITCNEASWLAPREKWTLRNRLERYVASQVGT